MRNHGDPATYFFGVSLTPPVPIAHALAALPEHDVTAGSDTVRSLSIRVWK